MISRLAYLHREGLSSTNRVGTCGVYEGQYTSQCMIMVMVSGQFSLSKAEDTVAATRKKDKKVHWAEGPVQAKTTWKVLTVAMAFPL